MKEKIEKLLDIETLDRNLFRGQGEGGEVASRVFGGHVIAQALAAAYKTVEERLCHSLHAYFIRPGDPSTPIIYEVDRARDGGSFTTRRVVAIQNGKQIFNMAASFHIEEEGWSHQHKMKDVKGPSGVLNRNEQRKLIADKVPEKRRENFLNPKPIEIRDGDKWARFEPYDGFKVSFSIDFDHPSMQSSAQEATIDLSEISFAKEVSRARTFGFLQDVEALQEAGLARGGSLDNAIVMDDFRVINDDGLRYGDEFVKHKVLDAIGALSDFERPVELLRLRELAGKLREHFGRHCEVQVVQRWPGKNGTIWHDAHVLYCFNTKS